ncbi:alpha-amylase [Vibrio sp. SM6]|uniref:Alpha-amylase n=1 Tax=Vibrio agarilyticus TaxID=2726741 RepID=A0A7X8TP97_9VIBR|nr:alpha-amylase [Vibrio agarilyticus]NLS12152.1 alpha-amylase [Vibrio agarilyticus]
MKLNLLTTSLLLLTSSALAAPTITIATSTTSRDFPLSAEEPLIVPLQKNDYVISVEGLNGKCSADPKQKIKFSTPLKLNCDARTEFPFKIRFTGDYAFTYNETLQTLTLIRAPKTNTAKVFTRKLPDIKCEIYNGGPVTIKVGNTFAEGETVRDAYSGQTATVTNGAVELVPSASSGGLVLLERANFNPAEAEFDYRNASIYFILVDRFNNGDPSNDNAYGRQKDGKDEIGTFHGGDLKGVTAKLDYIKSLGVDVIWLSPIVEQIHGFVGGGDSGSFPFYGYHGYWTRDFTKIDENFGRDEDLKTLVDEAHKRGIKILLDAVVNHPGYATLADIKFDDISVMRKEFDEPNRWQPPTGANWHQFHGYIDYKSPNWSQWWGGDWVRSGLPGYPKPGSSDIELTLAGMPDFRTESTQAVTPPKWLLNNPGTRVEARDNYTVADYLIEWQTDWVKRFGIDGYRVDTVKHVEPEVWKRLKKEATTSLETWRKENGASGVPFWMMGEVWAHGPTRSPYFDDGFNALINFDLQKRMDHGAACFSSMADTYAGYAKEMVDEADFLPVSYMSSHDTELFANRFGNNVTAQRNAANAMLLSPGAVQIYYGDEVARPFGPYADDFHQGTRSDMIWDLDKDRQGLLSHWQKVGNFRSNHPAIGAGEHRVIEQDNAYVFSRTFNNDAVVVAFVGRDAK